MLRTRQREALLVACLITALGTPLAAGEESTRIDDLRRSASEGDVNAQFQLGFAFDHGIGASRNSVEAAKWYRKAAEKGHAEAQNSLGSLYQHGAGVPRDNTEAVHWYRKAAELGLPQALSNLGYMYDAGLGVKEDKNRAFELYRGGAEKGDPQGMVNLGVSYWRGEGVKKDIVQAHLWLDLARFYTQKSQNMKLKWHVRGTLDEIKKEMTKDQIRTAKKLAKEWHASHSSGS